MIVPGALGKFIHLYGVVTYAHQPMDNGTIEIWASGKCGWFQIVPDKSYQAIYDQMVQDISLLYFVEDFYKFESLEGKKVKHELPGTVDKLFAKVGHFPCQHCL